MFKNYLTKSTILSFFILFGSTTTLRAQDEETPAPAADFEPTRSLFFGINANGLKDFGKQANFFRGYNEPFGLIELLAYPTVKSELYAKTNYNFTLAEYPSPMIYNFGIGAGLNVMYMLPDVNLILNGSFTKLTTAGIFTLSATNPSNPSGDDIIKTESISGIERRTWIKAGLQLRNEINARNDFFVELAPVLYVQRALKNEVNIEGSTYSLLVNYQGYLPQKTSYTGYGFNLGFGIQTMFLKNKLTQVGVNFTGSKLNMVEVKGLNYAAELYLSVFL
ncbi:MAG TPA: hypothetical protein VD905_09855 [Flavobacteriales bacterium]|nr:hypothetical protein [Flavobacteriales bacterium]